MKKQRKTKRCKRPPLQFPCFLLLTFLSSIQRYPCGLIAHSFFNDQFTNPILFKNETDGVIQKPYPLMGANFAKKNTTYASDLEEKFIARKLRDDETRWTYDMKTGRDFELPPVDDEDLINWMRISFKPTFTKLYRRINEENFTKGDVSD